MSALEKYQPKDYLQKRNNIDQYLFDNQVKMQPADYLVWKDGRIYLIIDLCLYGKEHTNWERTNSKIPPVIKTGETHEYVDYKLDEDPSWYHEKDEKIHLHQRRWYVEKVKVRYLVIRKEMAEEFCYFCMRMKPKKILSHK